MLFQTSLFLLGLPLLNASPIAIQPRVDSDTENGLTDGSGCKAMTVIFARGTTETGNVGTLTGPPFFDALEQQVGASNVAVQGVDYPADIPGFLAGGDAAGSQLMAQLVTQAMTQCPNTTVVMSGYSQGGQLVHNAAKMMDAATSAKVSSAIIFGDPDNGTAVGTIPAAKTKIICHATDNICMGGDTILAAHLTYSQDAGTAASFAASAAGM
ncbi:Cutinase [Lachnellula suecica]|uniref:Cutinase n=1 Tax=Lachnellula suecica TaxID=602035 RepID=A0A8T9CE59_9HELO|nr:Cutinase [Lachnellula suecica]